MINYFELAKKIASQLQGLPEVRGIVSENSLFEFDHAHPYMSVNLGIYYGEGGAPGVGKRREIVEALGVEISNETRTRTYGHIDEIPLELHCIDKRIIDYLVHNLEASNWASYEKHTEIFYTILHGHILMQRDNWLDEVKGFLSEAPELMWINLKSHAVSRMTLDLALLQDALSHHDRVLIIQAQGRFLEALLQVLFLINRQFIPPLRLQQLELEKLELLPFDFAQRFDEFLDMRLNSTQRLEAAMQLATEVSWL